MFIYLIAENEYRQGFNKNGKIEGKNKADFGEKILALQKNFHQNQLKKTFFKKWLNKYTNSCEKPEKKMEDMQLKLASVGKSLRKSLSVFRFQIEKRVYSIYCKSVNSANVKKQNSFLVFVTNFKHFLRLNSSLLEGCVNYYADIFDHVDDFTKGFFYKLLLDIIN